MRYYKKIMGERIYLSPMNVEDAEVYTKWMNDYEISSNLGNYRNLIGLNGEKKILEELSEKGHNYAIVLLENDRLIGNISIFDIDGIDRKATVGLFIGENVNRNKGYGSEALKLILSYGFKELNLHYIMLEVHSDNERAIGCYKKVGFQEYGRRHEAKFKNGNYVDIVYMEILE